MGLCLPDGVWVSTEQTTMGWGGHVEMDVITVERGKGVWVITSESVQCIRSEINGGELGRKAIAIHAYISSSSNQ